MPRKKSSRKSSVVVPIPAPRCLAIRPGSEYVGCSVWAMRQLYWSHKIQAVMVGRRLLFPIEELDAYIDRLKAGAA